jgi:hypothetical protein
MRGECFSLKRAMEICRAGETSEILIYFPEFKPQIDQAGSCWETLAKTHEEAYERLKGIPEQKAFALEATKLKVPGALFSLRSGKVTSIRQFLQEMRIENLMLACGVK